MFWPQDLNRSSGQGREEQAKVRLLGRCRAENPLIFEGERPRRHYERCASWGLCHFPQAFVHQFRAAQHELIWVLEDQRLQWIWPEFDPSFRNLVAVRFEIPENVLNYPLRFEAREHHAQRKQQIRHQDDRFRLIYFLRRKNVHIHSVEVLSGAWDYAWDTVWLCDRHVEFWLYLRRIVHWLPYLPWWIRAGLNVSHNGDDWHALKWCTCYFRAQIPLFQIQRGVLGIGSNHV